MKKFCRAIGALILGIALFAILMVALWAWCDCLFSAHAVNDLFFAPPWRESTAEPKPNVNLTNPLTDAPMDESKADTPTPKETATEKEEPLISSTTTGAGEEFDGTKTLNRPLTWWEKKLARKAWKISLNHGWKHSPLEDKEKVGTHMITVVTQGAEAGEFAGIYYRDTPLEEWEKQLARTLLELARENGGEDQSEKK